MSSVTIAIGTQEEVLAEDAVQQAWWRESASVIQEEDPVRFGAEFGPKRTKGSTNIFIKSTSQIYG